MMTQIRRNRQALACTIVGACLGISAGAAYASSQHTVNYWNHGVDGSHTYMTETNGVAHAGQTEFVWSGQVVCGYDSGDHHTNQGQQVGTHIHIDGYTGPCRYMSEGHINSPDPYLGHHAHN